MKIQIFMPVFNEADILPHTLRHLHEQGCAVHVIDGWSTDGSYEHVSQGIETIAGLREILKAPMPNVTVERFPASGPDPIQNCTAILKRIEDLAAASDADWILYTDADEWRRAPAALPLNSFGAQYFKEYPTLSQAVEVVDEIGFSAIDFRVFQFYCTDGTWMEPRLGCELQPDGPVTHQYIEPLSPENYFHHYDEADCISRIPNRKLWKNVGRVQLAGGGHEVQFPGMRVYPQKFTMKHYPFRTPAQAKAKIETRLARRRMEEHAKGWGVHYDQYPPGFDFCWDPAKLLYWKDTRSPLP